MLSRHFHFCTRLAAYPFRRPPLQPRVVLSFLLTAPPFTLQNLVHLAVVTLEAMPGSRGWWWPKIVVDVYDWRSGWRLGYWQFWYEHWNRRPGRMDFPLLFWTSQPINSIEIRVQWFGASH